MRGTCEVHARYYRGESDAFPDRNHNVRVPSKEMAAGPVMRM